MESEQLVILHTPGVFEWGLFHVQGKPNTLYRFTWDGGSVSVEKQAYIEQANGTHVLSNIGRDWHFRLTTSLRYALEQEEISTQH